MAEASWELSLARKHAAEFVIRRVGSAGLASECLNAAGPGHEDIRVSRGGILIPAVRAEDAGLADSGGLQHDKVDYYPGLAVVSRAYNTFANDATEQDAPGHYIFEEGTNGVWQGHFVPTTHAALDEPSEVPLYFMEGATPINTVAQANYVLELCQKFDAARALRTNNVAELYANLDPRL